MGDSPGPYGLLSLGRGSIGDAVAALKDGKCVARQGWNGKGLFIFMQVPADISVQEVVPKMQSLPEEVKGVFAKRFDKLNGPEMVSFEEDQNLRTIRYRNQLAMVYPDNHIYGWVPSPSDVLSDDWGLVE